MQNHGLILDDKARVRDWRFGGITGIKSDVRQPDGDWTEYLPFLEIQRSKYFDSMSCVTYSALNCLETLLGYLQMNSDISRKRMNWLKSESYLRNGRYDTSDRWIAIASGTTKKGNTFARVAEAIRKYNLVSETEFGWDKDVVKKFEDYMSISPLKKKALGEKASEWGDRFKVNWEWITPTEDNLREALRYAPLQVCGYAWNKPVKGIYERTGHKANHAFMLYKADDYFYAYDHYTKDKKKLALDYKFTAALKYNIEEIKDMPLVTIPDNTLVQEVEESGQIGLVLDNKIIVDEVDGLLATFIMRNDGKLETKTMALKKEVWDSFQKINLKKELLS